MKQVDWTKILREALILNAEQETKWFIINIDFFLKNIKEIESIAKKRKIKYKEKTELFKEILLTVKNWNKSSPLFEINEKFNIFVKS